MPKVTERKVIKIDSGTFIEGKRPANRDEIELPDGGVLKVKVSRGRVVGGTATDRKGNTMKVFMMRMMAADGGTKTCLFCREDNEKQVSYCHQIPCDWILGSTRDKAYKPRKKAIAINSLTLLAEKLDVRGDEIALPGGGTLKLKMSRGRIVCGTATDSQGNPRNVYMMRIRAADGGTQDKCYVCVCSGDGGCKCLEVPCPKLPPSRYW